jgi:hypothetical protein
MATEIEKGNQVRNHTILNLNLSIYKTNKKKLGFNCTLKKEKKKKAYQLPIIYTLLIPTICHTQPP